MLGPFTFTFTFESEEFEKFEKVAAAAAALDLQQTMITTRAPDGANNCTNDNHKKIEGCKISTLDNSKDGNSSTSAALFSAAVEKEAFNASEVKIKMINKCLTKV